MEKIQLHNQAPAVPIPIIIAGALVKGKENYLTIGAYGIMSIQPPVVYISSMKSHFTNAGIKKTGYFSINVPCASMVKETDYCGLVSGRDTDKSVVFTSFYGKEKHAPMIRECPINALCKLAKTVKLPNNDVFIGDVVEYYVDKTCLAEDHPDPKKTTPLLLYGRSYRNLGRVAGTAFAAGKALMKKE
ncbi:MAG: flavin reductase family protein [Methanoregula sp.]|uniref:flavin reductase family protein n=1 Tax=Methanoregula sp. TaxID=2052170 RepID=UPI003BAF05E7